MNYDLIFSPIADAFDIDKLLRCMERLKQGHAVDIPIYDFQTNRNIFPPRKV